MGVSAPPKSSILIHKGDGRSGGLAHHGREAKTKRRSYVEIEGITVLVAQKMIVLWFDSQLVVSSAEVCPEELTVLTLLTDDIEQGIQTG